MQAPWQPKPGDVIVRRPRQAEIAPVQIRLTRRSVPVRGMSSPMLVVYGFLGLVTLGTVLLFLPIANTHGEFTPIIDAVFTAVSAVTVTGLVVVDTATYWSAFGQGVIFALIFVGGLGFMTSAAFLLILVGQRLGLQNQLAIRQGLGVRQLGGLATLVRNIVITAIVLQMFGGLALYLRWYVFGSLWDGIPPAEAVWQSAFHAVSAFNNAGFVVFPPERVAGDSVTAFGTDYAVLGIIGILIIFGGIGYAVIYDVVRVRRISRFSLDTKLVLVASAVLLFAGAALIFGTEFNRPGTLGGRSVPAKAAEAVFQSVSGRTAGFSTIDWGQTSDHTNVAVQALMFIGGASASTAGGIKIGTFAVIVITILATVRAKRHILVFGREIPADIVRQAMVVGAVASAAVFTFTFLMAAVEDLPFSKILFETVSAFGTVGLSTGITAELSDWGKGILAATMFMGRFGPLTLALLMQGREHVEPYRFAEESIRIG